MAVIKAKKQRIKPTKLEKKERRIALAFVAPLFIGFIVFTMVCMVISVIQSFTDYNPISGDMNFVGVQNYVDLFTHPAYSKAFKNAIVNTLVLILATPITVMLSLVIAALICNKRFRGKTFFRVIVYLPAVTSIVAINFIWNYMFKEPGGFINSIFGTHTEWLKDDWLVKVAMIIKNVWGGLGVQVIMFMAGIQNIPEECYEAADIDGAGPIKKFFKVTIPLVTPVIFYTVITGLISGFQMYTDVQLFAGGQYGARTIVHFIWQYGIGSNQYGLASAASFLLAFVIMIFTAIQFKFNKWVQYTE